MDIFNLSCVKLMFGPFKNIYIYHHYPWTFLHHDTYWWFNCSL